MGMHHPPNPGEFILAIYIESCGLRSRFLAKQRDVSAPALSRVEKVALVMPASIKYKLADRHSGRRTRLSRACCHGR